MRSTRYELFQVRMQRWRGSGEDVTDEITPVLGCLKKNVCSQFQDTTANQWGRIDTGNKSQVPCTSQRPPTPLLDTINYPIHMKNLSTKGVTKQIGGPMYEMAAKVDEYAQEFEFTPSNPFFDNLEIMALVFSTFTKRGWPGSAFVIHLNASYQIYEWHEGQNG